jgi:hypothetical protein
MKILIIGQPRTKSTALKMYIQKIYPELSSIELNIFKFEKENLLEKIKRTNNIVVRIQSCYIIDYINKKIINLDSLNFEQYDKIYFCTRENSIDAMLSDIARKDLYEKTDREHYNENDKVPIINIKLFDILNKLRENLIFSILKKFVELKIKNTRLYEFKYSTFEKQFEKIFKVKLINFKIPIKKSNIDYKKYTVNYKEAERWFNNFNKVFKKLTMNDIADKNSIFWKNSI